MKGVNNIVFIVIGILCMTLIISYISNKKIESAVTKVESEWEERVKYHRENKKKGKTICHETKKVVTSSEYNLSLIHI